MVRRSSPCYFFSAGCGDARIGRVVGQVSLDGSPLADARTTFMPLFPEGSQAFGTTDAAGRYMMELDNERRGVQVGRHSVVIETMNIVKNEDGSTTTYSEKLPPRYHEQTELQVEVKSGKQTINFDLTSDSEWLVFLSRSKIVMENDCLNCLGTTATIARSSASRQCRARQAKSVQAPPQALVIPTYTRNR